MRCDVMLVCWIGCSWLVEVLEGEPWEEVVTRMGSHCQSGRLPWAATSLWSERYGRAQREETLGGAERITKNRMRPA